MYLVSCAVLEIPSSPVESASAEAFHVAGISHRWIVWDVVNAVVLCLPEPDTVNNIRTDDT
jgi:hypothetical protein